MYACLRNKLGEYRITSWKHEERTYNNKYHINVGVVGYVVHAKQTSDSRWRSIVQGMSIFDKKKIQIMFYLCEFPNLVLRILFDGIGFSSRKSWS